MELKEDFMGVCSVLYPNNLKSWNFGCAKAGVVDALNCGSRSLPWCDFRKDALVNKIAVMVFQAASYLTDPLSKCHEFYRRIYVIEACNPEANAISNLARKIALGLGAVGWASLAIFTTLPGALLRYFGSYLQANPFIYAQGPANGKVLPDERSFSLLSWNICGVDGGYAISDGGVLPWSFRIDNIINKIIEKNADVNCLYEVFDPNAAFYICEKLKERGYSHFYFNIGPRAIGVSSGILVASKYNIKNPEFSPFSQDILVGRTKNAAKGVFAFDLESQGKNFARIYSTHLQHSEEPQFPTAEEVEARKRQMQIIVDKVNAVRDRCIVVTGDLNLDDDEYNTSSWQNRFQKGNSFGAFGKTWGGDEFCACMVGKRISEPLNLDHTMVVKGTARAISTSLVQTGYNPAHFKAGALSDHEGLMSRIYTQTT